MCGVSASPINAPVTRIIRFGKSCERSPNAIQNLNARQSQNRPTMLTRQQESYYALEKRVRQLSDALEEMLEAFSMENIGLEASKRRLEAKKRARAALEK